jgi:hypothetical protein
VGGVGGSAPVCQEVEFLEFLGFSVTEVPPSLPECLSIKQVAVPTRSS